MDWTVFGSRREGEGPSTGDPAEGTLHHVRIKKQSGPSMQTKVESPTEAGYPPSAIGSVTCRVAGAPSRRLVATGCGGKLIGPFHLRLDYGTSEKACPPCGCRAAGRSGSAHASIPPGTLLILIRDLIQREAVPAPQGWGLGQGTLRVVMGTAAQRRRTACILLSPWMMSRTEDTSATWSHQRAARSSNIRITPVL